MTAQERRVNAKKAALARWSPDALQASHEGILRLGKKSVKVAVLANGKRLINQTAFLAAIGRSTSPKAGTGALSTPLDELPVFLASKILKPYISEDLRHSTTPIHYIDAKGARCCGYEAELLPKTCEVYLRLRDDSLERSMKVEPSTLRHIRACDALIRSMARVGIVALIDEATGYQSVRDRQALQAILDKYLTDEFAKWTKTFPDEFYQEMFRLKGYDYPKTGLPDYVGRWTNLIVYDRLAPGVRRELQLKNPRLATTGRRKRKHHQHLTRTKGIIALEKHLSNVVFLMRTCENWDDFIERLDQAAPRYGDTLRLPLKAE